MSLDSLFTDLHGIRPPSPFASAEQVRRRGRQRAHRQALTAGAAVLVVAGGTGVSLLPRPGTTPPPPPPPVGGATFSSSGPSPSRSTDGFLTAADLGDVFSGVPGLSGAWRRDDDPPAFEGDRWFWAYACASYATPESLRHQAAAAAVNYTRSTAAVLEIVERYAPGWAERSVADAEAIVSRCAREATPPGTAPTVRTVVGRGFAGDESVLVRVDQFVFEGETVAPEPVVMLVAVVRVGDRVATLRSTVAEVGEVQRLAVRAAQRLG